MTLLQTGMGSNLQERRQPWIPQCSPLLDAGWRVGSEQCQLSVPSKHIFPKSPSLPGVPTASQIFRLVVFKLVPWFLSYSYFGIHSLIKFYWYFFHKFLDVYLFLSKSSVSLLLTLHSRLHCCHNTFSILAQIPLLPARAEGPSFHLITCIFTMCSVPPGMGEHWIRIETKK